MLINFEGNLKSELPPCTMDCPPRVGETIYFKGKYNGKPADFEYKVEEVYHRLKKTSNWPLGEMSTYVILEHIMTDIL